MINHVVEPNQHLGHSDAPAALKPITGWTLSGSFEIGSQSLPAIPVLAGPWSCRPWKRKTRSGRIGEREFLVQERVRTENRIAALLATQGKFGRRPSLRSWDADMRALRTRRRPPAADPSRRRVEPLAPWRLGR